VSDPLKFSLYSPLSPLKKKFDRLGAEIRIKVGKFVSPASVNFAATQDRFKIRLAEIFFRRNLGAFGSER
jgi:hypothetical protein